METDLTKQAFANTFIKLLNDIPFSKLTISKLCDSCNMNRTSFYYHFQDKYDLVCWIYDKDMKDLFVNGVGDYREYVKAVTLYFYENRNYYKKVMTFNGDNPFSIHLKDEMRNVLNEYLVNELSIDSNLDFYRLFFEDAVICSVERWIMDDNCLPPEDYLPLLESCLNIKKNK